MQERALNLYDDGLIALVGDDDAFKNSFRHIRTP